MQIVPTIRQIPTFSLLLLTDMIQFSILHLVLGLQYNCRTLGSGAQTNPSGSGRAGEMLVWRLMLTGPLLLTFNCSSATKALGHKEEFAICDFRFMIWMVHLSDSRNRKS
jgi:hypothetical protein